MAFPTNWPPRVHTVLPSLRFVVSGTATANFSDNAYMFKDGGAGTANPFTPLPVVKTSQQTTIGAQVEPTNVPTVIISPVGTGTNDVSPVDNSIPKPMAWSMGIRITTSGTGGVDVSFDGTNVHDIVPASTTVTYNRCHEAGISIRGTSGATPTFIVRAW